MGKENSRLHSGGRGPYSPVIEIDDDSHSRFIGASEAGRVGSRGYHFGEDGEDSEWKREIYYQPRNSLLSLTADFVSKCSAKLQEVNKKTSQEKNLELLDNKCFMRLVDVAHNLLKMAPYDIEVIKLGGLQKYMHQVFPLTDWSLESMRPSLMTIIRRLDKLFAKIQKSLKVYNTVDWSAAASLLKGVYLTLWRHPYIVNVPNLKTLIGACQCLVVGEESLTTMTDPHSAGVSSNKRPNLPPESFCSIVFQLVALQVLVLGNTFTLEQRLQLAEHPAGGASRHNLLTHEKGELLLLNLLLPLCLKVGSGKKDAPKMRKVDVLFSLNLLLNLINPGSHAKGGVTSKDIRAPTQASAPAVNYNPVGDARSKLKSSSLDIAFLGKTLLCLQIQPRASLI